MREWTMLEDLQANWHWVTLRGVVAVWFGMMAFFWPGITLTAMILLWGAFELMDGVVALVTGIRVRDRHRPFLPVVLMGVLGIATGLITLFWPGLTAFVFLLVIGSWALITGILQVIAAIRLRKVIDDEWTQGISGAVSILFGLVILRQPGTAALALVWVIGAYAVFFGFTLIALGLRLRGEARHRPATV